MAASTDGSARLADMVSILVSLVGDEGRPDAGRLVNRYDIGRSVRAANMHVRSCTPASVLMVDEAASEPSMPGGHRQSVRLSIYS